MLGGQKIEDRAGYYNRLNSVMMRSDTPTLLEVRMIPSASFWKSPQFEEALRESIIQINKKPFMAGFSSETGEDLDRGLQVQQMVLQKTEKDTQDPYELDEIAQVRARYPNLGELGYHHFQLTKSTELQACHLSIWAELPEELDYLNVDPLEVDLHTKS